MEWDVSPGKVREEDALWQEEAGRPLSSHTLIQNLEITQKMTEFPFGVILEHCLTSLDFVLGI